MEKLSLEDGDDLFEVTLLHAATRTCTVLFSVGGGGDPGRHLPLLTSLADRGCSVVAPHFERLVSPFPALDHLVMRARRLKMALDLVVAPDMPVAGVGHSIGASMLLALARGRMWLGPDRPVPIIPDERISRLVLLAPATGFFQAPGALDAVNIPILAWAGAEDVITPPSQAELLADLLGARIPVEVRITPGAGHFSFMNEPPPMVPEPLPDRDAFLAHLAAEVGSFITQP